MSQPSVIITEIDGALGVLPTSAGQLLAFMGHSTSGPLNLPATFARASDMSGTFGEGPMVEAAAYELSTTGRPVLVVRTDASIVAVLGAVTKAGTGTATTPTIAGIPNDDYDLMIHWLNDGTIGTTGLTYQVSYDGGRTTGSVTALALATTIVTGGVTWTLGTGTIKAGDTYSSRVKAPSWNSADIAPALLALGQTTVAWEQLVMVGELPDAPTAGAIDSAILALAAKGKFRSWMASARVPNAGESEATYLSVMSTAFSGFATTHGTLCAGACKVVSGVTGRQYRRPVVFALAAAQVVSEEIDTADINLGALPGVAIRDANGNVDEHDESAYPGLDDARFTVLRTWDGYPGVYINRPQIFAVPGSDFDIIPNRRVMNLADAILRNYFVRRLNRPIRVDMTTGFILEGDAVEIEGGANAALRSGLLAQPKASGVKFVLSRTDNVLSTKTLHGVSRVLPLAYPEWIYVENGFYNPALAIAA
jgi:hypothetical protein